MMQANAEIHPEIFRRKSAKLWELTRLSKRFIWTDQHTACFKIWNFRDANKLSITLTHKKPTFILV